MVQVALPDGSTRELDSPATALDLATSIGPRLAKAAIAARLDGKVVGLDTRLPEDRTAEVAILTSKDEDALAVMRHSCAHVMARAVMKLFPEVQLAFGPTIENGFYYDFELPNHALSEADFEAIEAEMKRLVELDEPFERIETPRDQAVQTCADLGQTLKVEHIKEGLAEHGEVSFYRNGEFLDLCRGPHVPKAGTIGAFKLLSVAGAYWKGDQSKQQLQRLYATAFFSQKDLDAYLTQLEEAKRRDHRVLGKKLDLFTISPVVGSGLILWQPKGAIVRGLMEQFVRDELQKRGYLPVVTPNIGRIELYETSGHYPYYKDSMFAPITMDDDEQYILKPMNCPHHIMIYKSKPRSYRDLPLRLAEFGTCYRYEQSGELSGMTRVRCFTQDDAHIFCAEKQTADEIQGCIEMTKFVLSCLGLNDYRVRLGFREPGSSKYVGAPEVWDRAQNALIDVCQGLNIDASREEGEAAFYGPKADFVVTDCLGREWQLGTVQLDYNLPSDQRFGLEFIGSDNSPHRPVMIHRAPLGSLERFIGVLIEHFAGAFPLWLAPEQVRVMPVSEKTEGYARKIEQLLREKGLRVQGDYRPEKLGSKIRDAQLELIPYMAVVGPRDEENGTISLRDRTEGDLGAKLIDEAIDHLLTEVREKRVRQTFAGARAVEKSKANEY
ncbi:MAG: threonine--tRNA ligase [Pirellulaceae bacterium]